MVNFQVSRSATGNVASKSGLCQKVVIALLAVVLACAASIALGGCSSGPSSSSTTDEVNGYPVEEYNSDIDHLESPLSNAQSPYDQLEAMGDPNSFTTQNQVDEYNDLVERYNDAADSYNQAARDFSDKHSTTIDGTGTHGVDPDEIDLPQKK